MIEAPTEHRYQFSALRGDYIRSAAGLVLTGLPLLVAGGALIPSLILGALAATFCVFGIRTWLRQSSTVRIGPEAIRLHRFSHSDPGKTIAWDAVDTVKLAYYSTRRDKAQGWMNLKIRGDGHVIIVDSMIDGFDDVSLVAAKAAVDRGLMLNDTTVRNFAALGIIIDCIDGRAVGARKDSIL